MIDKVGYLRGKHYTEYVPTVTALLRDNKTEVAEKILLELLVVLEKDGDAVAPGYYQRLAIMYRKQNRNADEVQILERFARQKHGPGVLPPKLLARLNRARTLAAKKVDFK